MRVAPLGVYGFLLYPYTKPTTPMFLPLLAYFDSVRTLVGEGNGTPLQYSLAWKIPWTEEPDGLQSMGLLIVGHD